MSSLAQPAAGRAVRLAGIILIVAPVLALIVKAYSLGWMIFIVMMIAPLLVVGYALQIVVAANGMLRARGALRQARGGMRAVAAAWATSVGVVLTAFFFVDGGDQGWGSTFMLMSGLESNVAAGDVSTILCWIAGVVWLAGWVWLVVEWIIALVERRRAAA